MGCWLENIFLWTTLCENGYVFHGYCSSLFLFFFLRLPLYQSWMCQLVYYEGFVSIGSCSQQDFCVEFSQSTSWMTSIVSRPGWDVSRWWWSPRHRWRCCLRSWYSACHRHSQRRSHCSWADRLHLILNSKTERMIEKMRRILRWTVSCGYQLQPPRWEAPSGAWGTFVHGEEVLLQINSFCLSLLNS